MVSLAKLFSASDFIQHSFYHSDEATDDVNLLHYATNYIVFTGQLQLILLQRQVQCKNILVKGLHLEINYLVQLYHAYLMGLHVDVIALDRKYDFGDHE